MPRPQCSKSHFPTSYTGLCSMGKANASTRIVKENANRCYPRIRYYILAATFGVTKPSKRRSSANKCYSRIRYYTLAATFGARKPSKRRSSANSYYTRIGYYKVARSATIVGAVSAKTFFWALKSVSPWPKRCLIASVMASCMHCLFLQCYWLMALAMPKNTNTHSTARQLFRLIFIKMFKPAC